MVGEIMTVGEINVTLQLFGSVLSLMIIFCLFIGGNAKTKTGRLYVLLLILNMGGLLFDALAYMFRGKTYPFAYFGVRASNFLAFCCLCAFATACLSYLNQFVSAKKPGACRPYMMISGCVCASYLVHIHAHTIVRTYDDTCLLEYAFDRYYTD